MTAQAQESACSQCGDPNLIDDPNYSGLCEVCAWRAWAQPLGWDEVECIECELGRPCSVHPENIAEGGWRARRAKEHGP